MTVKLLAGAAIVLAAFSAGWTVQGWRLNTKLAEVKLDNAESITAASQVALADYQLAAKTIKEAAGGAQTDITTLGAKLDAIDRRIKNAKPPVLPDNCRPGPVRLRNLAEAAAATDATISRPTAGK